MERPPLLPLPTGELPESLRRFAAPDAPGPARLMAARGLVPVKGGDLVGLLVQLAAMPDPSVQEAARSTLQGLPEGVLHGACEAPLHPSFLDAIAQHFAGRDDVLERLVLNHATHDTTIASIARGASEPVTELVATNQQRLLGAPAIIEALYKNKRTRMSTADRLIELAARHGLELTGIPAYKEHVEALMGQLIPEPTDEPLPSDTDFQLALAEDAPDADGVIERDPNDEDGSEMVSSRFKPLAFRIREMTTSEKIRFAVVGDAAARALLVREPHKAVYFAAISSPQMTEGEAASIAHSKDVAVDVLRYIGNKKDWLKSYEVKSALVFNPKAPLDIAIRFLAHLRPNDLKTLSQSRSVAHQLKTLARQRLDQKDKKQ